jgi:hypothetical protein
MRYKVIGGQHHGKQIDLEYPLALIQLHDPLPIPETLSFSEPMPTESKINRSCYRRMEWSAGVFKRVVYVPQNWSDEQALFEIIDRC